MKQAPVRPKTVSINARIQETGGPTGGARLKQQVAGDLLAVRDDFQNQAIENAYVKGQTVLTKDLERIENDYASDPDGLTNALEEYSTSFLDEVTDPNMRARFELQITKGAQSAVARSSAKRQNIINEETRVSNLQAFEAIKAGVPNISRGLLSDDPALALASSEELQEVLARTEALMSATDADGQPIFNSSFRVNQLIDLKDTALSTAALDKITRSQDPKAELAAFDNGETLMRLPNAGESTIKISNRLMGDLQNDLGVSPAVAAGIVGNLAHETGGFQDMQEISPLVEGSRGGFGFAQWTGPRRVAFEKWADENNLDPSSYEANKGYLIHELKNTPEGRVLKDLAGVEDAQQAAQIFSDKFLRPGIPHTNSRLAWTQSLIENADNEDVDLVNIRHSMSDQGAKLINSSAKSYIAQQDAQAAQQTNIVNSNFDLAIATATDDPDGGLTKAEKIASLVQQIDNNPEFNNSPDGIIKGNTLKKKAFAALKEDQERFERVQLGANIANGTAGINRQDSKSTKAFNEYFDSMVPSLNEMQPDARNHQITQIISNARFVPEAVTGQIQSAARSENIEEIREAIDLIDRVVDENPHMSSDLAPESDVTRMRMINDKFNSGIEIEKAIEAVDKQLDPRNKVENAIIAEELKSMKIDYKSKALGLFDSSFLPFKLGLDQKSPQAQREITGLTIAYQAAFEDHYAITRDEKLSQEFAQKKVNSVFGVSDINGKNQVMMYPPERYYGNPLEQKDNKWMQEQMFSAAKVYAEQNGYTKKDLRKNLKLITNPKTTKRTAAAGEPEYVLGYVKNDGGFDIIGDDFYFDASSISKKNVKEALEKRDFVDVDELKKLQTVRFSPERQKQIDEATQGGQ